MISHDLIILKYITIILLIVGCFINSYPNDQERLYTSAEHFRLGNHSNTTFSTLGTCQPAINSYSSLHYNIIKNNLFDVCLGVLAD
jgi:hypothetical protein